MAHSSLTGIEPAPLEPEGRSTPRLGPSDSSDSGSDTASGTADDGSTSDRHRTGERASVESDVLDEAPTDIAPDRIVKHPDAPARDGKPLDTSEARDLAAEQARSTEA